MSRPDQGQAAIDEAAALWHARLDAPDMDWDAFGAWLDADPAHRTAYDAVALIDADIDEQRVEIAASLPANDAGDAVERPTRKRLWWAGGGFAVAAGIAALLVPPLVTTQAAIAYATGPTATRTITLRDGSHIVLDRNSRLAVRDGRSPIVEMANGSAWFDIRHDPSRAMTIKAGDYEVRDIGTRFELARSPGRLAVSVDQGQVTVGSAGRDGARLAAGERIDIATADGSATVRPIAADAVARWRQGQLAYRGAPLTLVAADVSRYAGRPISVDPAIADMQVSLVLAIGDGSRLVEQIEALLPVKAVATGRAVRFVRSPR